MSRLSVLTDEQSKINNRLEAHMIYICPECGRAFRTQGEWRQHLNTVHDYLKKTFVDFNFIQIDENFHECQICFKLVENAHKTIALLQYHHFMHLKFGDTYRCVHCELAFPRRRALNDHLLGVHLKEIENYEDKLKRAKRKEERGEKKTKGAKQPLKRKDLLQKALMDIDLQTEEPDYIPTATVANTKAKPNASEQALDRCLDAYEDILRKEKDMQCEADLDALCQEFFDDRYESTEKIAKPVEVRPKQHKEVVTIEIDALGEEEVHNLRKKMKTEPKTEPDIKYQPSKRRRLSTTPERERDMDIDSDLSNNGLAKLVSYLCPKCGKEIDSMDAWRTHVFEKHNFEHFIENSFKIRGLRSKCLQCHELLETTKRSELQKHCFKHLPYRSYLKCTLCERTKSSMSKMYNHIRYNHQEELQRKNQTQLLIKPEPQWMSTKRSVQKQETTQTKDDDRICPHCKKSFKTLWRYERHMLLCKAIDESPPETEITADALLQHLREGRSRLDAVWKKMTKDV